MKRIFTTSLQATSIGVGSNTYPLSILLPIKEVGIDSGLGRWNSVIVGLSTSLQSVHLVDNNYLELLQYRVHSSYVIPVSTFPPGLG